MGELCKFLDHSASQMLGEEAGELEPPLWFGTVYILDPLFQTPPLLGRTRPSKSTSAG